MRRAPVRSLTALAVAVVVGALIVTAVVVRGFPAADTRLNDGSVWVTNGSTLQVARFNAQIDQLAVGVQLLNKNVDLFQDAGSVVTVDRQSNQLQVLDPAAASLGSPVQVPAGAVVALGGSTVAVVNPASGGMFVRPITDLGSVDLVKGKPDLELGAGGLATVTASGEAIGLSVTRGEVVRLGPSGKPETVKVPFTLSTAAGMVQLSATGDTAVVLDRSSGKWWIEGGSTATLGDAATAQLQAPAGAGFGVAAGRVAAVAASSTGLYALVGNQAVALTDGSGGTPSQPVVVAGCAYGAFVKGAGGEGAGGGGASGEVVRACDSAGPGAPLTRMAIPKLAADARLVFRVNRDVVVLNDVTGGNVWLPNENMKLVAGWSRVAPPKPRQGEDPNDAVTEQVDPNRSGPNRPPVAVDDTLTARAGRSTLLPVLDNDSDPDGDIITVSKDPVVSGPRGTVANRIRGGAQLQLTIPAGAEGQQVSFTYQIDDGRGGTASASVRVSIISADQEVANAAPIPRPNFTPDPINLGAGTDITFHMLSNWRDPDGDDLYLVSATPPGDDELSFSPDGTITFRDANLTTGRKQITVVVSDGVAHSSGTVVLNVSKARSVTPVANGDYAAARAGQTITVDPLANDVGDGLTLSRAAASTPGGVVVANFTDSTFTFTAARAGSYYVVYVVNNGKTALGLVRIDVTDPPRQNRPPVAARDIALLPEGGSVLVDPLANDEDPDNDVLVLQAVSHDPGVKVRMIQRQLLELSSDAGLSGPITLSYRVSDGHASVTGTIVVLPAPPQANDRPVATDDEATVRAGSTVTVRVLANDTSPAGLHLTVDRKLITAPAAGTAWTDGEYVRYTAPAQGAAAQELTYRVRDSRGRPATARVRFTIVPADGPNSPPQAAPVTGRVLAGTTTKIPVPVDGVDPDGDTVRLVGLDSAPSLGMITRTSDQWLLYTAFPGSAGTDTFSYVITDALGARAIGTVSVGVVGKTDVNNPPQAADDAVVSRPGRTVRVPVLANDSDPDGDSFGFDDPALDCPTGSTGGAGVKGSLVDNQLQLVLGARPGRTVCTYSIVDDRGATAAGKVMITIDPQAPLLAPVLTDDLVDPADVAAEDVIDVPVLNNDYDPDGDITKATVSVPDYGAPQDTAATVVRVSDPQVTGRQVVRVHVGATLQTIRYQVTDPDGQTAWAVITVPGKADSVPALRPGVGAQKVVAGDNLDLDLNKFIIGTNDRRVILTADQRIWAANGVGTALAIDRVRFVAPVEYAGPAALTVEVTDGASRHDTTGRTAVLTIPITVLPAPVMRKNEPPHAQPVTLTVGAGEPAKTFDLNRAVTDPEHSPLTYAKIAGRQGGVTVSLKGSVITVQAAVTAEVGQHLQFAGTATDSDGAKVQVSVTVIVANTSRPKPQASDDVINDAVQGKPVTVNATGNDFNPFPDTPLTIETARADPAQGTAQITGDGTVQVTPNQDFVGTMTVYYTITDATGDPARQAQGTIRLTVIGVPGRPGVPRAVEVGDAKAVLQFTAPDDHGAPITSYQIRGTGGGTTISQACPATTCTITGLTNDTKYRFTVTAINRVGLSVPSAQSGEVRPDVRPDPLTRPTPGWGDGWASLTWTPPTNHGSAITTYTIELSSASGVLTKDVSAAVTTYQWSGLTNGHSYRFRIQAHNKAPDPSDWSPYTTPVVPAGPPSAPTNVTAQKVAVSGYSDGQQAQVSWKAPADNNGAPIETYLVYVNGTLNRSVPADRGTSVIITGLTNGNDYTFQVAAKQRGGTSAKSSPSAVFTPYPDLRPGNVPSLTGSTNTTNAWIKISWTANTANGPDVTYQYQLNTGAVGGLGSDNPKTVSVPVGRTYTAKVRACRPATNECGAWSPASKQVLTYAPPPKPSVSGTSNAKSVTFHWSVPSPSYGVAISKVQYHFGGGNWTNYSGATGERTVGDAYNTSHTIYVRAVNAKGQIGPVATATAKSGPKPQPAKTVYLGRSNNDAQHSGTCSSWSCSYIKIKITGFSSAQSCTFHNGSGSGTSPSSMGPWTIPADGAWHTPGTYFGYPEAPTWVTCGKVESVHRQWQNVPVV